MKLKNILFFAIGPLGIAALGFISIPIMAWLFSPEDIARLTILQVINTFAILVLTLGLDQAYIREYENSKNRNQLLKNCIIPGMLLLSIITLIILFNAQEISLAIFDEKTNTLAFILILYIIFSYFSRFLSLILRMQERGLAYSLSQLVPKATFLILILMAAYFYKGHLNFYHLLLIQLISISIIFIFFTFNTKDTWLKSMYQPIEKVKVSKLLNYGYPLALGGIAYWGLTSIDKIILKSSSTLEQLGIYSISISFAGAALILQSIFSTIWAPTVFKWINKENGLKNINNVRTHLIHIITIVFLLCCSFAWSIDYLLPPQYTEVKYIFMACLCFPLLYTLSETTVIGINISKKTHFSLLSSLIALIVNILLCYYLIPIFGAAGAAISTSISFLVFLICRTEFSILTWQPIPRKKLYLLSSLMVISSIFIIIFKNKINYIFYICSFFITLIYISWYFLTNLKQLKNFLK